MAKFLVTGSAGFIGFHVASRLLQAGHEVLGIDNFSGILRRCFKERDDFVEVILISGVAGSIDDMAASFWRGVEAFRPDVVIHLAAQAGVRYSNRAS